LFSGRLTQITLSLRYLLLVYDVPAETPAEMSKREILEMFARTGDFIAPDHVWLGLRRELDRRSVYSYLLRLKRQGLIESGPQSQAGFSSVQNHRARACPLALFSLAAAVVFIGGFDAAVV